MKLRESHMFLSILTPTYNRANKLSLAYNSLTCQSFKDFEWIIIDDGSDDNTDKVVQDFIKENKIKIIYKKSPHGGKHNALKIGYNLAHGDYFLELDSDDSLYQSESLAIIKQCVDKTPSNYSCICGCFIDQNNRIFPRFDERYIDFDTETFFNTITSTEKNYMTNMSWVLSKQFARSAVAPQTVELLPYFPENVIGLRRIMATKDFHLRLYNAPWYRYNVYQEDSVSVDNKGAPVFWYEAKSILEDFKSWGLDNKYKDFFEQKLEQLFRFKPNNVSLYTLYKIYKKIGYQRYFFSTSKKKILKYIFSINHSYICIFGIKIYKKHRK